MNNEAKDMYELDHNFDQDSDGLGQYLQSLSPEAIAHMSKPESPDVHKVIENHIISLLGGLSHQKGFDVSVSMSREQLGQLLASAMMGGYFVRNAEQRFAIEKSFQGVLFDFPEES